MKSRRSSTADQNGGAGEPSATKAVPAIQNASPRYGRDGLRSGGTTLSSPPAPTGGIRWLVVTNPSDEPFSGVAVLHADYRTRTVAPVTVGVPGRSVFPSRVVNETLSEWDGDGKRRWAFDLEFFCDCSAHSLVAYAAWFGDNALSHVSEGSWEERHQQGSLSAVESETPPDEV